MASKKTTKKTTTKNVAKNSSAKKSAAKESPKAPAKAGAAPSPAERQRAQRVFEKLRETYPNARCALDHENAYQLLTATILSAQTTDVGINQITPGLFKKYPTPKHLAAADRAELEQQIKKSGFYRNKAKNIMGAAQKVVDDHGGEVPDTMEELLELPGVARKTANVVLGNVFNKQEGFVVDTHVKRLSYRLGFTTFTDPEKIERDLMALFPREEWTRAAHVIIFHGRRICQARNPACEVCPVNTDCPKIGVKKK